MVNNIKQKSKESDQDSDIALWLKEKYGKAVRFEKRHADRYTEVGLPDINICLYGMSIQIEDKLITEFPRDNQLQKLLEYDNAGAISFWVDTFDMFLEKWELFVEGDPRFKYMKLCWEQRDALENLSNKNQAIAFIEYKTKQLKIRQEQLLKYKEKGLRKL